MDIHPASKRVTKPGPADWFTGSVQHTAIIDTPAPARLRGSHVAFEAGARTAWHTHPLGQTLIVVAGRGRAQTWGGPVRELNLGDVVWIPPGEKHWHGAAPDQAMTHIALQEAENGVAVVWLEHVADADYLKQPSA